MLYLLNLILFFKMKQKNEKAFNILFLFVSFCSKTVFSQQNTQYEYGKKKSLADLVSKLLNTNIPVNKCIKHLENHFKKTNMLTK